jgi:[ribosomal protein S18]-alanine N-acetyltransferase
LTPILRQATAADLPAVLKIEREAFADSPWRKDDFLADECTVAEVDGRVAGFLVARQTFPAAGGSPAEREILNVAVAKGYRRQGIATALLRNELQRRAIYFLEVRESNGAALALYRKLGFVEVGRRAQYYTSPVETAIVMQMK